MERQDIPLDEANLSACEVVEVLDSLPGAFERAQLGREQATIGETKPLDEL